LISAEAALERLREGNRRFVAGRGREEELAVDARRRSLLRGQRPHAVILGCADSRVPAEIVFDQGLGELFVVRVAGNVVAEAGAGSVEFAAERLGVKLVVVLGHSDCGAIRAAVEEIEGGLDADSPNLRVILDRIRRGIGPYVQSHPELHGEDLVREAVRAHAQYEAAELRRCSPILRRLAGEAGLTIVAAEYHLDSGVIDFLDD
jgi:carbonic anhydrase